MNFLIAQGTEPAGGAAIGEIIIATGGAAVVTAALLFFGLGHRTGRVAVLGNVARWAQRISGLPYWAAFPTGFATGSLILAVFGMYWDISLHIDVGRDEGPLANPAHYCILGGLFGIFASGILAIVLPKEKPSSVSIRLAPNWHAPLGGVLIAACGAFSLIGFPLDAMWHRIFGQDVTLWGPTHLMLIGGASMTLVGIAVLVVEALRWNRSTGRENSEVAWARVLRAVALTGGFLLGLSTFQAEFDFGVPQFRFVFQPILIMIAAGVGLVTARMWGGPGTALAAVAFFLAIRGALALSVGPLLGETTPHMPLYLAEALVVELIALRVATTRPLAFAAWCGAGIGTVGLAAEWGWSHLWMPLPWPSELLPEAALLAIPAAMAGSLIGGWIGHRLRVEPSPAIPALRTAAVAASVVIAAVVGYSLMKPPVEGVRAQVSLSELSPAPERTVAATVALDPPDAADDAEWLTLTAWQGDGLVVDRLARIGPGRYRTNEPVPVHGNWKSLVRLHSGRSLTAIPVFLPRDVAIPAKEVPATREFTRTFVADHEILQREQKSAAGWLTGVAYGIVVGIALALLALLAWGLHRLASPAATGGSAPAERREGTGRSLPATGAPHPAGPGQRRRARQPRPTPGSRRSRNARSPAVQPISRSRARSRAWRVSRPAAGLPIMLNESSRSRPEPPVSVSLPSSPRR